MYFALARFVVIVCKIGISFFLFRFSTSGLIHCSVYCRRHLNIASQKSIFKKYAKTGNFFSLAFFSYLAFCSRSEPTIEILHTFALYR